MDEFPQLDVANVFQILIQPPGAETAPDGRIGANIDVIRGVYPGATHTLLRDEDLRSFISAHFSVDVSQAYETLAPYAYKTDLARYCLLFIHGGLYADLSIRLLNRMNLTVWQGLGVFRDLLSFNKTPWATSIGLICAAPQRVEFKVAIDMIVENCRQRTYGASPLEPTGPGLFGRAVAQCNNTSDLWVGDVQMLSPHLPDINVAYIAPDGRITATLTKTEPGGRFSIPGSNSYPELWCARKVYGEA